MGLLKRPVIEQECCPDEGWWETLRAIVVNWVCRDRADHLCQFDVRSKPACRPGRTEVYSHMLTYTFEAKWGQNRPKMGKIEAFSRNGYVTGYGATRSLSLGCEKSSSNGP